MMKRAILLLFAFVIPTHVNAQAAFPERHLHIKLSTAKVTPIPIERGKGIMILPGMVAGKRVNILFDTGTQATMIDQQFARDQGLSISASTGGLTTGLSVMPAGTTDTRINIGDVLAMDGTFVTADLSGLSRALGISVSAVMGADTMAPFVIVINPEKNWIAFGLPGHISVTAKSTLPKASLKKGSADTVLTSIPKPVFVPFESNLIVKAQINGEPCRLLLDYGSSEAVTLKDAVWDRVISKKRDSGKTSASFRADGLRYTSRLGTADTLRIGDISASDVPVSSGPASESGTDGMLGLGLLASSTTILNMPKKQIWFFPVGQQVSVKGDEAESGLDAAK